MSEIIQFDVSGQKDLGCITPEELIRVCIDHNVDRINSMACLWKMTNIETKEEQITTNPFDEEFNNSDWNSEQLNKWEFDIN